MALVLREAGASRGIERATPGAVEPRHPTPTSLETGCEVSPDARPDERTAWAGPRERALAVGVENLGDSELVAIVLGTGRAGLPVSVLSVMLLEEHAGVGGLARAGLGEIAQRSGVGLAKGARLVAAIELGRRAVAAASLETVLRVPNRAAVEAWAQSRLATLDHEELWLLALDNARPAGGAPRGGGWDRRAPCRSARRPPHRAPRRGERVRRRPQSSQRRSLAQSGGRVVTQSVERAAAVIGTPLLDHVVIARRRAVSMLEAGLMGR